MKELIDFTNSNHSSPGFTYLKQLNFDAEKLKMEFRITFVNEIEYDL